VALQFAKMKVATGVILLSLFLLVWCDYKPVLEPFDDTFTTRWVIPAGFESGNSHYNTVPDLVT
jgi:hypothetical protein